jgi:sortase (surface protein transpeptidase)
MLKQQIFLYRRHSLIAVFFIFMVLLAACQIRPPANIPAQATVPPAAQTKPMPALPNDQSKAPQKLAIPALGLELAITPMGWTVVDVNGQRTTKWVVPTDTLGWAANSAGAGATGRVVLAGHQASGAALLAPLARGEITVGQELVLTDGDGMAFVYRVTEVTEPIALAGATAEEVAKAAAYVAPSDKALLTLVTGWPDFTTTHRVFAVAEFVGMQK